MKDVAIKHPSMVLYEKMSVQETMTIRRGGNTKFNASMLMDLKYSGIELMRATISPACGVSKWTLNFSRMCSKMNSLTNLPKLGK